MEQNFTLILSRMEDLYQKGLQIQSEIKKIGNKPGKIQQLRIREKTLRDQIDHLAKRIKSKVNGTVVDVTFKFNGTIFHGRFVNWSNDDVYQYYRLLGKAWMASVEVIKIERQNTFISDRPLDFT